MSRGQSITGWWAYFPGAPEEPRRFTGEQDAMEFWPDLKADSVYSPVKCVRRVWWDWDDGHGLGFQSRAADHPGTDPEDREIRNTVKLSVPVTVLTNPLSHEAWEEERQALKSAALEKKNAKKKPRAGENARLDALADNAQKRFATKKAQRQAYAKGRA